MNDIERELTRELNTYVKTESFGKYDCMADIGKIQRWSCVLKIILSLIIIFAISVIIWNNSPILIMLGWFPYEVQFFTFARIMEATLIFCMIAVTTWFSRNTCKESIKLHTEIIKMTYVSPTKNLLVAYNSAKKQMLNSNINCPDWESAKFISIREIIEFIDTYKQMK